jgi:hypothetical protein
VKVKCRIICLQNLATPPTGEHARPARRKPVSRPSEAGSAARLRGQPRILRPGCVRLQVEAAGAGRHDGGRAAGEVLRAPGTVSCAISQYKKVARQRGNGIAESLHLGSGNLDVQLGRQRLPLSHPLRTLKLSQRAVEGSFQTGFVSNQPIEIRRLRNLSPQDF